MLHLYIIKRPALMPAVYHSGRGDKTRTCDPMLPKHVRYQLRYTSLSTAVIIYVLGIICK